MAAGNFYLPVIYLPGICTKTKRTFALLMIIDHSLPKKRDRLREMEAPGQWPNVNQEGEVWRKEGRARWEGDLWRQKDTEGHQEESLEEALREGGWASCQTVLRAVERATLRLVSLPPAKDTSRLKLLARRVTS